MRLLIGITLLLVAAAGAAAPAAAQEQWTLAPVADVSLPFWCDWGYDWEERCWRDDSDRLPVGGDDDKVWRAALRFALPPGEAWSAELRLYYDGTCLAPRKTVRRCDGRPFSIEARPILTSDWFSEREVEVAPDPVARVEVPAFAGPRWLAWDITDLAWGWSTGEIENAGVLLQLAEGTEDFGVGGPAFPSSTFANAALRPRLEAWIVAPGET